MLDSSKTYRVQKGSEYFLIRILSENKATNSIDLLDEKTGQVHTSDLSTFLQELNSGKIRVTAHEQLAAGSTDFKFSNKKEQLKLLAVLMNETVAHDLDYNTKHPDAGVSYLYESGYVSDSFDRKFVYEHAEEKLKKLLDNSKDIKDTDLAGILIDNSHEETGGHFFPKNALGGIAIEEVETNFDGLSGSVNGASTNDVFAELISGLSHKEMKSIEGSLDFYWPGESYGYRSAGDAHWWAIIDVDAAIDAVADFKKKRKLSKASSYEKDPVKAKVASYLSYSSKDGWEQDKNTGNWLYDPEGILEEDSDGSVPMIVPVEGGYDYYCQGDDHPTGNVSFEDMRVEEGLEEGLEEEEAEEEAEEAALDVAKELAMEKGYKVPKKVKATVSVIIASIPTPDRPPSNLASMMMQCESKGRKDLGKKISEQWVRVLEKYPQTRLNWAAASVIGGASIKKNVFKGKEFVDWFVEAAKLSPEDSATVPAIQAVEIAAGTPAMAIPKKGETPEDWKEAAAETEKMLGHAQEKFWSVDEFLKYLNKEIADLARKVAEYGPGGKRHLLKNGEPHSMASRVPKWVGQLKAYSAKLEEITKSVDAAEAKFEKAAESYTTVPVTTVEFEHNVQESLSDVLAFILDIKDLKKQKQLLEKFKDSLARMESSKVAANVTASEAIAEGVGTFLELLWDKVTGYWEKALSLGKKLIGAVDSFSTLAHMSSSPAAEAEVKGPKESTSALVHDEVGEFWYVTMPNTESVLQDILGKTNVLKFMLQFKGGLKENQVIGLYKSEARAKEEALNLLRAMVGQRPVWNSTTSKVLGHSGPADKNQLKILLDTVKNPDKALLGGPSVKEAIETLKKKFKYSDSDIKKLVHAATKIKVNSAAKPKKWDTHGLFWKEDGKIWVNIGHLRSEVKADITKLFNREEMDMIPEGSDNETEMDFEMEYVVEYGSSGHQQEPVSDSEIEFHWVKLTLPNKKKIDFHGILDIKDHKNAITVYDVWNEEVLAGLAQEEHESNHDQDYRGRPWRSLQR